MSNYTPTTAEVSAAYIQWTEGWSAGGYTSEQEASEEFNRWLSGRIRKAQEKAWAEGIASVPDSISNIAVEADGSVYIDGWKQDDFRNPYTEMNHD